MVEFKAKLQKFMNGLDQKGMTLDEIYEGAEARQAALVAKMFDACVDTVCSCGLYSQEDLHARGLLKNDGTMISSEDFKIHDMSKTDAYYKLYRDRMTSFLKETSPIYVYDKGIKARDRSEEKLEGVLAGRADMIKDVNRATIVSEDYRLLDHMMKRLDRQYAGDVCGKETWDMKSFGLLSKSKYLNNEGFVSEIHFNERHQMELGEVITHDVYEVFRMSTKNEKEQEKFNESFLSLARKVKENYFKRIGGLSEDMVSYTGNLTSVLNALIATNIDADIATKKKVLIDFNRRTHQELITKSDLKWQKTYLTALKRYNSKTEAEERKIPIYSREAFSVAVNDILMKKRAGKEM